MLHSTLVGDDAAVPESFSPENLLTVLPLAIPAAVLLTLSAVLFAGMRRRRRAKQTLPLIETDPMRRDTQRTIRPVAESNTLIEPAPAAVEVTDEARAPAAGRVAPAHGRVASHPATIKTPAAHATQAAANRTQSPAVAAGATPLSIVERITAAEASGRMAELAPLYLELARAYQALGRAGEALTALRSCAGMGAMHGPPLVHAQSRVELAEVAFKAGDLTGACEQWQIAKAAFHDHGQREAHALVDQRMRDTGCPTDWVLTEF